MRQAIIEAGVNDPDVGAPTMHRRIEELRDRGLLGDARLPSQRAVGDILKIARAMTDDEKRRYRVVFWPESFEAGTFPWEAGAAYFELRRHLGAPPRVTLFQWYWRVTLALGPSTGVGSRWLAALRLLDADKGDHQARRAIEQEMMAGQITAPAEKTFASAAAAVDHYEDIFGDRPSVRRAMQEILAGRLEGSEWQSHEQQTKAASTSGKMGAGSPRSRRTTAASADSAPSTPARKATRSRT